MDYSTLGFEGLQKLENAERDLIVVLNDFEKKIKQAGEEFSPSQIAQYLFDLAKEYNRFYAELSIFNESDPKVQSFRIAISAMTAKTIKAGMKLLGIKVPERM